MAKDDKKAKGKDKAGAAKKTAKKGKGSPVGKTAEFGVAKLADFMEIEPATCRVKLRNAGVKPEGGVYDFGSADGIKKMAKKLAA